MHENQGICDHVWVSNSGKGGMPEFRRNRQMSYTPTMHVMCNRCKGRTWLTNDSWNEYKAIDKVSVKKISD